MLVREKTKTIRKRRRWRESGSGDSESQNFPAYDGGVREEKKNCQDKRCRATKGTACVSLGGSGDAISREAERTTMLGGKGGMRLSRGKGIQVGGK